MNSQVRLRTATREDAHKLWDWRNESDTRAISFNAEPIAYEDHLRWFEQKISDPNVQFLIAVDADNSDAGYARLDLVDGMAQINLSIDRNRRGRGIGSAFIRVVADFAIRNLSACHVVAYVRPDNERSIGAFRRAGFAVAGTRGIAGVECIEMIYESGPA